MTNDHEEIYNIADIFGEDVFDDSVMRERLPKLTYDNLKKAIDNGTELDLETADVIAQQMKEWAIEKGATHYTHWFQPLTGYTAEKHDSFISKPNPDGRVLMSFSGKNLIKGERTPPPSRRAVCARLSRRAATRHGTARRRHLSARTPLGRSSVSRPLSAPTAERRSIRRRRCFAPWRPSTKRRPAC